MGVWRPTVSVVLSACLMQLVAGTTCQGGRVGDMCSYSCHCTPPCNQTTGVCNGACDPGWFGGNGQTCQRENVAFNKTTSSPHSDHGHKGWTADKAVDGNRDQDVLNGSCYHSHSKAIGQWTVDLGQPYRIHNVRIYNRAGYPHLIRTVVLTLSNSSSSIPGATCYTFPSDTAKTINDVYDVMCDGTGRYFTITHSTEPLNLCEVEIYVCSPGLFGDSCNQFCHCFQATCDPASGVCPGECRPGWQGDRCDTVCSNGSYGPKCSNMCTGRNCAGDSLCDHIRGTCVAGCKAGWMGDDCTEVCSDGSYGQKCINSCTDRKCAGDSLCDHINGTCVSGCAPGWMGGDCREGCSNGSYGQNCSNLCSDRKCAGDSPCDHIRGTCVSGCEPGWMGEDCREACSNGSYGQNCNNSCNNRKCAGDSPCDHIRGTCDSGCEPGWMREDCREVQTQASTSPPVPVAAVGGSVAGLVLLVLVLVLLLIIIRSRRNRGKRSPDGPVFDETSPKNRKLHGADNVYMNVGFEENESVPKKGHTLTIGDKDHGHPEHPREADSQSVANQEEDDKDAHDNIQPKGEAVPGVSGCNYYNLGDLGHVIPLSSLEARVREIENHPQEAFERLPGGSTHSYGESQKAGNKGKNRFRGYYPYDYNRVVLHNDSDGSRGDYINASYLDVLTSRTLSRISGG